MPLDMTGNHRYNHDVHYRRYLSPRKNRIVVICVQDFDYRDYDASRFADLAAFDTEEEAQLTPLRPEDVVQQVKGLYGDTTAFQQALRLLQAIRNH
ncbi:hypothetical protein [Streptomyces olivaceiscleroticus]|uniref:Uncharacterized protein n=1 Tax=Streptomyces olivaceiscleroticus TaxID=68245 RepID=A0ABN1BMQ7_9ACTN